jgi:hypothetical protein
MGFVLKSSVTTEYIIVVDLHLVNCLLLRTHYHCVSLLQLLNFHFFDGDILPIIDALIYSAKGTFAESLVSEKSAVFA